MAHGHDPVVEEKMGKIKYFKDWISAFMLVVALLTLGMVSINCVKQGLHLFMMFFGGGGH